MWVKWAFAIKLKQLSTSHCFKKGYFININNAQRVYTHFLMSFQKYKTQKHVLNLLYGISTYFENYFRLERGGEVTKDKKSNYWFFNSFRFAYINRV